MTNTRTITRPVSRKWLAVVAAFAVLVPALSLGTATAANAWTCGSARTSTVNYHSPVRSVDNVSLTSSYSCGGHSGTDWANGTNFEFKPVAAGTVYKVDEQNSCHGTYIVMEHADGNFSIYAHIKKALVAKGDYVSAGELIGVAGSTGDCAEGTHLHLSMTRDWEGWNDSSFFNPIPFINSH